MPDRWSRVAGSSGWVEGWVEWQGRLAGVQRLPAPGGSSPARALAKARRIRHVGAAMQSWWGETDFASEAPGSFSRWGLGPLELWAARFPGEWQLAWRRGDDALLRRLELNRGDEPPAGLERRRYLFADPGTSLHLLPRVADRPIVAQPATPVLLPAGQRATFFMSSPVWLEVSAGDPPRLLAELPCWLPSKTWLGEDTLTGTLCYAARTRAQLEFAGLATADVRAVTAVTVTNHHRQALAFERMGLPLPQMSLFRAGNGALWTEAAEVDYDEEGRAPVRLASEPPPPARPVQLISGPRHDRSSNLVVRALSAALRGVLP